MTRDRNTENSGESSVISLRIPSMATPMSDRNTQTDKDASGGRERGEERKFMMTRQHLLSEHSLSPPLSPSLFLFLEFPNERRDDWKVCDNERACATERWNAEGGTPTHPIHSVTLCKDCHLTYSIGDEWLTE
jgi:hypothetical protein